MLQAGTRRGPKALESHHLRRKALADAAQARSVQAQRAVERAVAKLQREGNEVNFVSIAKVAKVSRQYLYTRFRKKIEASRRPAHHIALEVDGTRKSVRDTGRVSVLESALRSKIKRLEAELAQTRSVLAAKEREYTKALGKAEHWWRRLRPVPGGPDSHNASDLVVEVVNR